MERTPHLLQPWIRKIIKLRNSIQIITRGGLVFLSGSNDKINNMETPKIELYLGMIIEVPEKAKIDESKSGRQTYEVKAMIPGVADELVAVPLNGGSIDEPFVGDVIIIMSIDPSYHSVNFYSKLKEDDYVGFRSNGKILDITPEYLLLGSDGKDKTYPLDDNGNRGHFESLEKSHLKMDDAGNIEINATGNETIKISGDSKVEVSGNIDLTCSGDSKIKISGNSKVEVSGTCELTAPDVKISGSSSVTIDSPDAKITGANLTINGTVAASGHGPFCGLPNCLFTGAPHIGHVSSGN